jgi:putative ABC transport system ATP-binding protein
MTVDKKAITCSGVTKSFTTAGLSSRVLRGVDLEVMEHEFMMIVGPSGCGKTTLISIIAGILGFDDGACSVLSVDLKNIKQSDLLAFRASNIGFIFQQFNLIPTISIAENVAVPLLINGFSYDESMAESVKMLQKVGLDGKEKFFPNALSGGQQQRVAIARALIHKPNIVICDEPTSALDHETGLKIMDLMQSVNNEFGTTFVIVTHDARIFSYADRIAYMEDGAIKKIEGVKTK